MRAMSRRSVVALLGATWCAAALGATARAQGRLPLIAVLEPASATSPLGGRGHFLQALADLGWIEGRTVRIETRYGEWQVERMVAMATELVALKPDVLYTHSDTATRVAMQTTTTVPIVVGAASDLVTVAGIQNLGQPGGNVTGVTSNQPELDRKRLEILRDAIAPASRIGYLFNESVMGKRELDALDASARTLGVRIQRAGLREPGQIEAAVAALSKGGVQAALIQDSVILSRHVERITALALNHRLSTISQIPTFAERGGLIQYGADVLALFRRSATHVDRILKGARVGTLPIEQPTKVDLVVNLKTAKALGVTLPRALLVRADRVIE